jgi:hypothetical protein
MQLSGVPPALFHAVLRSHPHKESGCDTVIETASGSCSKDDRVPNPTAASHPCTTLAPLSKPDASTAAAMNAAAVATRHFPAQPSPSSGPHITVDTSLPASARLLKPSMDPSQHPDTPPLATGGPLDPDSPFYISPKSPKLSSDVGRPRSQSRRTLGNWQLGKTIGQGSMGRVRLGHNLVTGELVCCPYFNPKFTLASRSQ